MITPTPKKQHTDFAAIPQPLSSTTSTYIPKAPVTLDDHIALLYPCKHKQVSVIQKEWCEGQSCKRHKKHIHAEAKTLIQIPKVVSSKNISFAANILEAALKGNR